MTTRRNRLPSFLPRLAILPLVMVAVLTTYWFLSLSQSAWRQIEALATANSDAVQWSLAQAEVELLVLGDLLHQAELRPDQTDAEEVRTRFDVFYSRMRMLQTAPVYAEVRAIPAIQEALDEVDSFLRRAAPVIDSPELSAPQSLSGLSAQAELMRPRLRLISLAGVKVSAAASERQRDRVATELAHLAIFALLLFVLLVILLAALAYLLSLAHKQTAQVQAGKERMRSVVAAALDGIIVADAEGRVIDINEAAVRIFGHTRTEAVGQDLASLILPEHLRDAHRSDSRQFWETGRSWFVDTGLFKLAGVSKDERIFPVEMSVALAQSDRRPTLVYFIRDISGRIEAEQELVAARDRALQGERAKAELLAVMSHEMRTPLNGIIGSLDLLTDTRPSPRQRKFIEAMRTSGQMLLDRVNTVLEISRFDAGQTQAERSTFDPRALTDDIAKTFGFQAKARKNRLKVSVVGTASAPCLGDRAKLQQVLVNLIGNAIKFTENGLVEIEIERQPGSDQVEFRVIDTGIGIAEKDLNRVFDDFVTLDSSYGRKVEGTGLGLGITRRLVQAMQGTMGVESQPGAGSVFWVRLPLPLVAGEPGTSGTPDRRASGTARLGLSVLVIEDNAINRLVVHEMLKSLSCRVTEAQDGEDGIARAAGQRFDVILMDISMPRLDGIEATKRIRQGTGPNANTPIVALTAHALAQDLARFRAAGLTDALVKPVTRSGLAALMSGLVRHADGGQVLPATDAAEELRQLLGEDRIRAVRQDARKDLAGALADLADRDMNEDPAYFAATLHRMLGLASVVGFVDLVAILLRAKAALGQGDAQALGGVLGQAKDAVVRLEEAGQAQSGA